LLSKVPTTNMQAYELLKKASFMMASYRINESIRLSEHTIQLDDHYAEAYADLSAYLIYSSNYVGRADIKNTIERARAAALKSIQLNPQLAKPYWVLATIYYWYDRDFVKAERGYLTSVSLNDNDTFCHGFFGELLIDMGRFGDAYTQIQRCYEVMPLQWYAYTRLAMG
jgi:tetratricopeptide (TPR) repeat protein